jgi:hypothetical protein
MYRFFDSIIFKYIFSIKMMETIPDQLESCRYDVCVQKQLKFGMIRGVSFFTLSGHCGHLRQHGTVKPPHVVTSDSMVLSNLPMWSPLLSSHLY